MRLGSGSTSANTKSPVAPNVSPSAISSAGIRSVVLVAQMIHAQTTRIHEVDRHSGLMVRRVCSAL